MAESEHLVFVYGTLKQGGANHHLMENATLLGMVQTREAFPLVVAKPWQVPCMMHKPGQGLVVQGELYRVTGTLLAGLDRFEGVPHNYKRLPVALQGHHELCFAWFKCRSPENFEELSLLACYDPHYHPAYIPPYRR